MNNKRKKPLNTDKTAIIISAVIGFVIIISLTLILSYFRKNRIKDDSLVSFQNMNVFYQSQNNEKEKENNVFFKDVDVYIQLVSHQSKYKPKYLNNERQIEEGKKEYYLILKIVSKSNKKISINPKEVIEIKKAVDKSNIVVDSTSNSKFEKEKTITLEPGEKLEIECFFEKLDKDKELKSCIINLYFKVGDKDITPEKDGYFYIKI